MCVLGGCCSATESGFVCAVGADQATLVLNDCSAATRAILDASCLRSSNASNLGA